MNKSVSNYSFKYFGTMEDAMQSFPIGNGDIGANVWLSPDGVIHLLLSKTDAWSELYRLLKVAHVTMETEPRVFADGADFELNIAQGVLNIASAGAAMRIYADAFAPCVRISLKTVAPADIRLRFLNYRNEPIDPGNDPSNFFARSGKHGILESADTIASTSAGGSRRFTETRRAAMNSRCGIRTWRRISAWNAIPCSGIRSAPDCILPISASTAMLFPGPD